jgi:hypothetical protein
VTADPVDPDAVLARLRQYAAWEAERSGREASSTIAENAGALAEDFRVLDEWLTWAGTLPADWRQARPEPDPDPKPDGPMIVALRGWRTGARFAVVALGDNGIATLRLMKDGALSPFEQEAHVVNIIWHPDERAAAGLDEEEPPWPSS